jgi:hypothetical protein
MIYSNPVFDQLEEILSFRDNLFSLCMSCDGGVIVVDHVALAPARFNKIKGPGGRSSKREPGRFKGEPMMTKCACELGATGRRALVGGDRRGIRALCGAVVEVEQVRCAFQ